MSQTLVDISKMKDFDSKAAVEKISQIVSDAGFTSTGIQTSSVVGTAARKVTTSVASSLISEVASGTDSNISFSVQPKGTSGVVALGGTTVANASVQVPTVASSVNFVQLSGAITGTPVIVAGTGTDGTVDVLVSPKSTGSVYLGGTTPATASLKVVTVASSVDFLTVTPAATANPALLTVVASGTDSNVGVSIQSKGSGVVAVGGTTVANSSVQIPTTASAVNYLSLAGAVASSPPTITAAGTDSNIGITLNTAGTGAVAIKGTGAVDNAAAGYVGEFLYGELKGTATTATVTMTIAAPCVVTWTTHGFSTIAPQPVVFTTSSSLPTGITSGTVYYTVPSTITASTFNVATTVANALAATLITTTGSQAGTQTGTAGTVLSTGASADVSGLALTAGDWEVWGQVCWNANAATTVTTLIGAINSTSATLPGYGLTNAGKAQSAWLGTAQTATNGVPTQQLMPTRLSVSSTTNLFLVAQSAFATNINGAFGFIAARRIR